MLVQVSCTAGSWVVRWLFKFAWYLVRCWFQRGSTLAQIWFRLGSELGSHVAHMWFRGGSWFTFGSSCWTLGSHLSQSWFILGQRCFSFGSVEIQWLLQFSFVWGHSWSTFGAHVLRTRFRCCSDLALIGFKFGSTLVQICFTLGSTRFKFGSMLVYTFP